MVTHYRPAVSMTIRRGGRVVRNRCQAVAEMLAADVHLGAAVPRSLPPNLSVATDIGRALTGLPGSGVLGQMLRCEV